MDRRTARPIAPHVPSLRSLAVAALTFAEQYRWGERRMPPNTPSYGDELLPS